MGKATSLIATVGLTMGLLSGCGREATQAPAPQPLILEMTPVGDATERAEVRLFDLGQDAEVQIDGTGFSQTGAYYATYGREAFAPFWPIGLFPAPITVNPLGGPPRSTSRFGGTTFTPGSISKRGVWRDGIDDSM